MEIPNSVKLMDSGLAVFRTEGGPAAALNEVMTVMAAHGGTVRREGDADAVLDCSGPWRHRFVTAHVEASGDDGKTYAVTFREGHANTRFHHVLLLAGALLLILLSARLIRSWWSILPVLAVIAGYLYLNYKPERACVRRMKAIIRELDKA